MNILLINLILTTAVKGEITKRKSLKNCMICNLAQGFVNQGHKVTLIASEEYRPIEPEVYDYDIVFLKSFLPKIFKPALLPFPIGLEKYLKKNSQHFDMIISSEAFSFATLFASRIVPNKLILWQELAYHQQLFYKIPSKVWHNLIVANLMKKVFIIPRSNFAYNFISQFSNNVSNEIIDHGANGDIFFPSEESDNYFIIVACLVPRKNIIQIIKNFSEFILNTDYKDYKLHIVGDGPQKEEIIDYIKLLNMQNHIILHGFLPHESFGSLSRKAKGLLVDTKMDLNMVSIPEAIISGTPILTNTLPTSSKFIHENNLGIVKDNWDWRDLEKMINNYESFHQSCLKIRPKLTCEGSAEKFISLFASYKQLNNSET